MLAIFQLPDVLSDRCAPNASMTLDIHIVAEGKKNGLNLRGKFTRGRQNEGLGFANGDVYGLEDGNGECGSFTSS